MKVEPSAVDLLAIARKTLLDEIAPASSGPQRYAALMAANALAIAGRDLSVPPDAAAEITRLRGLLGDWTPAGNAAQDLRDGNRRLAERIRDGRFDQGEARDRLLTHLEATTRTRLAISNPRALER